MDAKTNRKDDMPESYSRPGGRHQASKKGSEDRLDPVGVATSPRAHSVDDAETRVSTVLAPTGHVPAALPARIHLLVQSRSTTCTAPGRPRRAPRMWRRGGGHFGARATANGNRTATRAERLQVSPTDSQACGSRPFKDLSRSLDCQPPARHARLAKCAWYGAGRLQGAPRPGEGRPGALTPPHPSDDDGRGAPAAGPARPTLEAKEGDRP